MTIAELARRMGKSTGAMQTMFLLLSFKQLFSLLLFSDMLLKVAARHGHDAVVPSDRKICTALRVLQLLVVTNYCRWKDDFN